MLNSLAETQAKAREFQQLRDRAAQTNTIQDVGTRLGQIQKQLRHIAIVFPALVLYIDLMSAANIRQQAKSIAQQLDASRKEFERDKYHQLETLAKIERSVNQLWAAATSAWKIYAAGKLTAVRDLTQIADTLPSMASKTKEIHDLLKAASALEAALPRKPEDMKLFHDHLGRLNELLVELEGLPSDVQQFLRRLHTGNATIADVTTTVLEWCSDRGLDKKLRISRL